MLTATSSMIDLPAPAPAQTLEPIAFQEIAGWQDDNLLSAFDAFRRSCLEIRTEGRAFHRPVRFGGTRQHWLAVCGFAARTKAPRNFFEANFLPFKVRDDKRPEGLFTGYYEPELLGSRIRNNDFSVPVYRKPDDLVALNRDAENPDGLSYGRLIDGKPHSFFSRKEIEQGALSGRSLEILWLKDWSDAFFLHIQGSGRVRLQDGQTIRLAYSAKSGHAYTSIGAKLIERGEFTKEEVSMQALRRWFALHPQAARELMWENESFIFFRETEIRDPALGPVGAQQVQLTERRSIAVDRNYWMFGMPVWLDTEAPIGSGGSLESFRRLLIAQDTGSAIKGLSRGDVFWGSGESAEVAAGHMKAQGTMIVLLPHALARDLELIP